ncbi:MAG: hypothetical protein K6E83_10360 [Clostridium sp.]|nr:hypothetical protein [Clostridium sp.]
MKLKNVLLTAVLMTTLSTTTVFAAETDVKVPENIESAAEALLQALLEEYGTVTNDDVETIIAQAKSELDQVDFDTMNEYGSLLIGMFSGGGTGDDYWDDAELDRIIGVMNDVRDTQNEYVKAYNAGRMAAGDVQIISNDNIYQGDLDTAEIVSLNCVIQNNYVRDSENRLWLAGTGENVVLFRQRNAGDGSYPVTEARFAEGGDGFETSLRAMCAEVDMPYDECLESIEISRVLVLYDLQQYLVEHPDIKGIEYEGAIRTYEELDAIWDAKLDAMSAAGIG